MIVTEEEARQRLCVHQGRPTPAEHAASAIAGMGAPIGRCCLGSRCMAWRMRLDPDSKFWRHKAQESATVEPPRPPEVPADWKWHPADEEMHARWVEPEASRAARATGYCGLAGAP